MQDVENLSEVEGFQKVENTPEKESSVPKKSRVVKEQKDTGKVKKNHHFFRKILIGLVLLAVGTVGVRIWQGTKDEARSSNRTKSFNQFTEDSEALTYDNVFTPDYPVEQATVYYDPSSTDLFDRIGRTFYLKYYDKFYGGVDGSYLIRNHNGSGLVTWINDNGTYYIVDADDTTNIVLRDVQRLDGYVYFQNYDAQHGGVDSNFLGIGNGVVLIYTNTNGTKTMVDANDMTQVIASGFSSYANDGDYVIFFYPDGTSSRIHNADIFAAHDTLVR